MNHRDTYRARVAVVILCLSAMAACKEKEGGKCASNENCAEGLYCVDADPAATKCMTEANGNAACRASSLCTKNGKCTVDRSSGNCSAQTDDDCAQSTGCKEGGACKASGSGFCK